MNQQELFFDLLRSGLWERGIRISTFKPIDFDALYDLADEQAVVGLVAAGLEHVEDVKIVKKEALPFMKKVFSSACWRTGFLMRRREPISSVP